MSEYIFNDQDNIENMIRNNYVDKNINKTISKLAKYNKFIGQLSDQESYNQIVNYMSNNCISFSEMNSFSVIKSCIKSSDKYIWRNITQVVITKKEMQSILALHDIRLEKLAFVLLADLKYNNRCRNTDYDKTFVSIRELYKLARVTMPINERFSFLGKLKDVGYIDLTLDPSNFWIKLHYANDNDDAELILNENNYKELAFTYVNWKQGGYKECKACGRLFKANKNTQYCKKCLEDKKTKTTKTFVCEDCGEEYEATSKAKTNKCPCCYEYHRKKLKIKYMLNYRNVDRNNCV